MKIPRLHKYLSMAALLVILVACGGGGDGGSGSGSSPPASLSISTEPTPQSATVGQTATFTVTAVGGQLPYSYQWMKDGSVISGGTSSSYTTPPTLTAENGSQFSVRITDNAGATITSTNAQLSVQASNIGHLIITEVSSCYYIDIPCWLEVYNPTSATINLNGYQLKSTSIDSTVGGVVGTQTYTLSSFDVPPDSYVIIAGNTLDMVQRGAQMLFVSSGNQVPFWTANGFVELINNNATIDFVRFGTSAQIPVTSSKWTGASATALPNGTTNYGSAIVRLYPITADNDSAMDWSSVSWVTAAGRNDVPVNAIDADADGIPDSAEVSGGTFAGLDLYAMGARTGQKDIFIEVDYMNSTDPGVIPRAESLSNVVSAFSAQNFVVHFDTGTLFSPSFSQASFNLGQGANLVPYEQCVTFDQTTCTQNTSTRRSIWDWKDEYFDLRRRSIFHYLLFGNSQLSDGAGGSSGLGELIGNDYLVTMGNWGFTTTAGAPLNQLINMQASTVMHELGHNLGLHHGGNVDTNYKPNYWSIMNYMYQLNGLTSDATASTAYQRWRYSKGDGTPALCSMVNSACNAPSQFVMSYSNGSGSSLNETSLQEANNVGRGSTSGAYADWNMNGVLNLNALSIDLNGDGVKTTLTDYNDWANLVLPFARHYQGNTGAARLFNLVTQSTLVNPIFDDKQPVAHETAPPASFFDEIRRAR
jgi:hypothetical protein